MSKLTAEEEKELRGRLEERIEALRRRSHHLERRQREEPSRGAEPRDSADLAAGISRDRATGHVDQVVREEIRRIEDALDRMDRGHYGVCAQCGDAIQVERLRAEPQALRCVDCASQQEA